jgi:predicted nucleic acid-binding protein
MLVVDASCLFEVVADTPRAGAIAARLAADVDQAAPHVIDVEVIGVIRAQYLKGRLDGTAAGQAVADLRDWPGERFGHRWLLERAWGLRARADLQDRSPRRREMIVAAQWRPHVTDCITTVIDGSCVLQNVTVTHSWSATLCPGTIG